jgi:dipeptidyl aminopeptidase/acylaminoacyl peptidase
MPGPPGPAAGRYRFADGAARLILPDPDTNRFQEPVAMPAANATESIGRSLLLLSLLLPTATVQAQTAAPETVDSARAASLYVSNRPEDHPRSNYAAAVRAKARTDSIFAARSRGLLDYDKISYRSSVGDLDIPAYIFQPLAKRGAQAHAALIWVHGGVHGDWDENYWPFIRDAVERGYVVIAPEYRGSTGYGEAFHNAIDYGGWEVDDVTVKNE